MSAKRLTDAQILLKTHIAEVLKAGGWPEEWIQTEYPFSEGRRWRMDIAIPHMRLAFECDGGKWHGGHRRGAALEADYERQNVAIMTGWRLLRFTNEQILDGRALAWLKEWL